MHDQKYIFKNVQKGEMAYLESMTLNNLYKYRDFLFTKLYLQQQTFARTGKNKIAVAKTKEELTFCINCIYKIVHKRLYTPHLSKHRS